MLNLLMTRKIQEIWMVDCVHQVLYYHRHKGLESEENLKELFLELESPQFKSIETLGISQGKDHQNRGLKINFAKQFWYHNQTAQNSKI